MYICYFSAFQSADLSSGSDWSSSDDDADESQPRPTAASKAPASPDRVSEPGSPWSDDDADNAGPTYTPTVVESKIQASAKPVQTNGKKADDVSPAAELKTEPEKPVEAPKKPVQSVEAPKKAEELPLSDSDSDWSDSDADEVTPVLPIDSEPEDKGKVKEKVEGAQTDQGTKEDGLALKDDWSEDEISPRKVPDSTEENAVGRPELTRQQSEESAWSDEDDDDIELAAAPKTDNSPRIGSLVHGGGTDDAKGALTLDIIKPQAASQVQASQPTPTSAADDAAPSSGSPVLEKSQEIQVKES